MGQTTTLLQDLSVEPVTVLVELGYRRVDKGLAPVQVIHRGKSRTLTKTQWGWLEPRQAIETTNGHSKQDHRMDRYWLK